MAGPTLFKKHSREVATASCAGGLRWRSQRPSQPAFGAFGPCACSFASICCAPLHRPNSYSYSRFTDQRDECEWDPPPAREAHPLPLGGATPGPISLLCSFAFVESDFGAPVAQTQRPFRPPLLTRRKGLRRRSSRSRGRRSSPRTAPASSPRTRSASPGTPKALVDPTRRILHFVIADRWVSMVAAANTREGLHAIITRTNKYRDYFPTLTIIASTY